MGTKSKKWKAIVSFAAFFISVNLLLVSLGMAILVLCGGWYSGSWLKDSFASNNYQDTYRFREEISGRLEEFLGMATGGPVRSWYYGSEYGYDGYTWDNTVEDKTTAVLEGGVVSEWNWSAPSEWGEEMDDLSAKLEDSSLSDSERESILQRINDLEYQIEGNWNEDYGKTTEELKKQFAKDAQKVHEAYKEDKNVLYAVAYDGKLKFTNTDEASELAGKVLGGQGSAQTGLTSIKLPEGYNFLLYFDGKAVSILKDGVELDVYGNGYYRDSREQWNVPGYTNYTVDEDTSKARVIMAVAQEPLLYIKGNYSGTDGKQQYSSMYWLAQNMLQTRTDVYVAAIICGVGLLLFAVYLFLRKSKAEVDRWFAKWTGKMWFEGKFLIFLLLVGGYTVSYLSANGVSLIWLLREGVYSIQEIAGMFMGSGSGSIFVQLLFLFLFWVCYLGINDLRRNPKVWQNSLCGMIAHTCRSSDLNLPVQKRMVHWLLPLAIVGVVLSLPLPILAIALMADGGFFMAPLLLTLLDIVLICLWIGGFYLFAQKSRRNAESIGQLVDQISTIRNGDLTAPLTLPADSDLAAAAQDLNGIQQGMDRAMEERIKSERMKVELVANVSHDIKTPLTSIISYIGILNEEPDLPDHVKDYVKVLDSKAQRLKTMIQDVFEVSKATSGQLPVVSEPLDLGKLLRQTLADMDERIAQSPVSVRAEIPDVPVMIQADGQRLYRVFQNLVQNALKYSLEGSRVHITLRADGSAAVASVKNTSKQEIPVNVDFTERFVRGDESRTDGGSGLGLSIASSFTEACGGRFRVENIADLFVVTVEFPLLKDETVIQATAE